MCMCRAARMAGVPRILTKSRPYSPTTVFLALSVSDAPQDVGAVIRAGAQGYVTKMISGDDLVHPSSRCMRAMPCFRQNWPILSLPERPVCRTARSVALGATRAHHDELDRLSNREQEVMRLIARGYTYKEVAAELFISIKTVETHISSVLRKLSCRTVPSSPAGPPIGALCDKRQMSSLIRGSSSAHITRRRGNRWGFWSAS